MHLGVQLAALFVVLVLCAANAKATELSGRVVAIADGDTITVLDDGKVQHRIRVAAIDAPERGQAYASRAREHLSQLVFGKQVRCEVIKTDRFGRQVANVYRGSVDVGLEQVAAGMAWHFKAFESEQRDVARLAYAEAEQSARSARRGLWADSTPIAPWDWRRQHRQQAGATTGFMSAMQKKTAPVGAV
jgi:endonuclease YncB( thermonuclease family)